MKCRNTSKTRSKPPVELILGRRVRLAALADFDLCKSILFKANEKIKTVPANIIIRKGMNTSFIQPENSTGTIQVSDNQNVRLDEDSMKTESAVEETISEAEPQLKNTDVRTSHQDEASATKSYAEETITEPEPQLKSADVRTSHQNETSATISSAEHQQP